MSLDRLLAGISKPVADVLDRALSDRELSVDDGTVLLGAQGADLLARPDLFDASMRARALALADADGWATPRPAPAEEAA